MQSTHQTQAIVLAGVHLWEESAFDDATPRPLLPVGHQPLICHVLRWLQRGGIGRATICANSTSRFIRKCLGPGSALGMDLDYYEDWTPRGPAGCVRDAAEGAAARQYLVVDGTIIPQIDLAGLLACHEQSGAAVTIAVSAEAVTTDPQAPRLSPVGVYVFEPHALQFVGQVGYQDIKEMLIPRLHTEGQRVVLHQTAGPCPRVSGLGSYLAVNEWLLEHFTEQPEAAVEYRRDCEAWIHRTARIDPTAQLVGPVMVGAGSRIGKDVMIIGPCVIGAECLLAAGAIVCRSVIWDRCRVGRGAAVDRCVLTHRSSVAGSARLYDRVHLPAPEPGRILQQLQTWTGYRAIPRSLPARRTAVWAFDPSAIETGNQGKITGTPKQSSVGAPAA